jgi:hypothetical protein
VSTPDQSPEKSWTEFGYVTHAQYLNHLEWERTARDVCECGHMRQEHGPACMHFSMRSIPYRRQEPCQCTAWTAPDADSDGLSATETAQNASGVHRTADGQETA